MEGGTVRLADFLANRLHSQRVSEAFPAVCDAKFEATLGRMFDRFVGGPCFGETKHLLVGHLALLSGTERAWGTPALRGRKVPLLQAMEVLGVRLGVVVVPDDGSDTLLPPDTLFWKLWGVRQERQGVSWEAFLGNPAHAIRVGDAGFSARIARGCAAKDMTFIGEICFRTEEYLRTKVPGLGKAGVGSLKRAFAVLGVRMGTIVYDMPGEGGDSEVRRNLVKRALCDVYRCRLPEVKQALASLARPEDTAGDFPRWAKSLQLDPKNEDDKRLLTEAARMAGVDLTSPTVRSAARPPALFMKTYRDLALQGLDAVPGAKGPGG